MKGTGVSLYCLACRVLWENRWFCLQIIKPSPAVAPSFPYKGKAYIISWPTSHNWKWVMFGTMTGGLLWTSWGPQWNKKQTNLESITLKTLKKGPRQSRKIEAKASPGEKKKCTGEVGNNNGLTWNIIPSVCDFIGSPSKEWWLPYYDLTHQNRSIAHTEKATWW